MYSRSNYGEGYISVTVTLYFNMDQFVQLTACFHYLPVPRDNVFTKRYCMLTYTALMSLLNVVKTHCIDSK